VLSADEPRYASIGREMAESGDWITPRLWGEPWFEKPPLLYWLVALGFAAGLGDDLAPRLPIALLSSGFLLLFFHQVRREFGERAALYASGILATSAGWLAYSHVAVTDLPLAATFTASLLLCLPWVRSGGRRGLLIAGVFLGFAVLAKGLVPLALMAPLLWIAGRRWPELFLLAGAAIAIASPWYLACYWQNGNAVINELFWKHHVSRFFSPELQHVQPWWYYAPVLLGLLFPWTPTLAVIPHRTSDNRRKLLLAIVVVGFVLFSAGANKLPGYLLPLIPAIAVLAGIRLAEMKDVRAVVGCSAILLLALPLIAGTLPQALVVGLSKVELTAIGWGSVVPVVAGIAVVFWLLRREKRSLAIATTVLTATIAVAFLKWRMFPELDSVVSARALWLQIRDSRDEYCVGVLDRDIRYGLNYYAHKPLKECAEWPLLKRLDR
jgi:4-amino-4-deoxy-L-arabinose transferase-like glycosyltransferase